ncbi:MAG: rubrerythrin family protein [Synergistaceae bacterium]|nr:rubrerythrin family protein [Synergistaceae bacterium]
MASKTMKNLAEGFAGESQANRKYLAFAEQADREGYPGVAKMFRAIASAETLHAHSHFRAMDGVKDTAANLQAALEGETYEFTTMYPGFIEDAEEENDAKARRSFHMANEAEKVHAALYKQAIDNIASLKGRDSSWYLCPVCGYVHEGRAPDVCPICGAKAAVFKENPCC